MAVIDIRTRRGVTSQSLLASPNNSAAEENVALETEITAAFSTVQKIQGDLAAQMKALLTLPQQEHPGLSKECAFAIGELSRRLAELSKLLPENPVPATPGDRAPTRRD